MRSRIALTAALSMVAVVGLETLAGAHAYDANSGSTIEWKNGQSKFAGQVTSAKTGCKRNRAVEVFKKRDGSDKFVGGDTSNRGGNWSVPASNPNGKYYAVVKGRHKKKPYHNHRCRRGQSKVLNVDSN